MSHLTGTYLVTSGDMAGFCLRAEYDSGTGGYYVYFSRDFSDPSAEGYDEWFEHREDAEAYMNSLDLSAADNKKDKN